MARSPNLAHWVRMLLPIRLSAPCNQCCRTEKSNRRPGEKRLRGLCYIVVEKSKSENANSSDVHYYNRIFLDKYPKSGYVRRFSFFSHVSLLSQRASEFGRRGKKLKKAIFRCAKKAENREKSF
jgi:hypothetical protein